MRSNDASWDIPQVLAYDHDLTGRGLVCKVLSRCGFDNTVLQARELRGSFFTRRAARALFIVHGFEAYRAFDPVLTVEGAEGDNAPIGIDAGQFDLAEGHFRLLGVILLSARTWVRGWNRARTRNVYFYGVPA